MFCQQSQESYSELVEWKRYRPLEEESKLMHVHPVPYTF